MKFGANLHRYQIVEWAPHYIDYRALKELYKPAQDDAVDPAKDPDLENFKTALDLDLVKVRSFCERKYELHIQKAEALCNRFGIQNISDLDLANGLEAREITSLYVELHDNLRRLLWYWLVNFDKILGSIARCYAGLVISDADYLIRIKLTKELHHVNESIQKVQSKSGEYDREPRQSTLIRRKHPENALFYSDLTSALIAIETQDSLALRQQLERSRSIAHQSRQEFLLTLLHISVYSTDVGSRECIDTLLLEIETLPDTDNCIHWLVSSVGRLHGSQNRLAKVSKIINSTPITPVAAEQSAEVISHLIRILAKLTSKLEKSLGSRDCFGRIPLHHAVQYGLPTVCREILSQMRDRPGRCSTALRSTVLVPDLEGLTSLDIAVLNQDLEILTLLLEDHNSCMAEASNDDKSTSPGRMLPGSLLCNALMLDSTAVVQILNRSMLDVNYRDRNGHTALYIAVRSGNTDYVKEILGERDGNVSLDLDAQEVVYGWTPLILASVMGNSAVVETLLKAGTDITKQDHFGWRAKDHAAFRGWLPLSKRLGALTAEHLLAENGSTDSRKPRRSRAEVTLVNNLREQQSRNASSNQSVIYVNLGALDTYKTITAVDMSSYVWPDRYDAQRESDFCVKIRAGNDDRIENLTQLPILEDMANKPWRFVANEARDFQIAFDIYHSESSGHEGDRFVGSAVALLDSLKEGLGPARESLIRNFTIPVLHKDTLKCIGKVTFYCLIMTPFPHPDPKQVSKQELSFPSHDGLPVIGHRGIGQNDPGRRQLQIGENTIESFLSAKDLGASYIEFDVQLTKDDVPVIYHDFLMSETGIDAPLHSLNLEQFKYISEAQSTEGDPITLAEQRYLERDGDSISNKFRKRSYSLNNFQRPRAKSLIERMKHTFEFKLNEAKGYESYKGNIRSEYIQASFATLEDLLTKLPESVRFDIEIKYPMLFEAHDWGMETSAVEVNHLVDNVLSRVYSLAKNRTIFFSSFSPEVCILLSNKQHIYPVFFLTESGHIPSADARADSLQEAIWFAKSWRLAGVISRSEPLVVSPQLIQCVKNAGLLCVSWGSLNDVPEHAKTQAEAGLEAIITNNVRLIYQTLNGEAVSEVDGPGTSSR